MKAQQKVNNQIYRSMSHAWWDDDVGELGRRLNFQESDHLDASYMGYAARSGAES